MGQQKVTTVVLLRAIFFWAKQKVIAMALKLAARSDPGDDQPALAALRVHRGQISAVGALDADWAAKETAEVAHMQLHAAVQAALGALEQRKIDAKADQEVLGRCDEDVDTLAEQIETERRRLNGLTETAVFAEAKLVRIRRQRGTLRAQKEDLNQQSRPLQYAARCERLAQKMSVLVECERAYVQALIEAFAVAHSIDELARAPGPVLPFAGHLSANDLYLPRPHHPAFVATPSPQRPHIDARIAEEAARVAEEL
jgi:hypothetical protein